MKIFVVNYIELNICPSKEQVLSNLSKVFFNASDECIKKMGSTLKNQVAAALNNPLLADVIFMDTSDSFHRQQLEIKVKDVMPDLLISYNLAGFELGTFTDSVLYNLLDCRQFHFLTIDNLPNKRYLDKLLSINIFIFRVS